MPLFQFVSPKEVKEGNYMVKTPVTVQTSVPIEKIMQALDSHVSAAPDKSSLSAVNPRVYIVSRNENTIVYACGNKVIPQIFVAPVGFVRNGDVTTGIFKIGEHFVQGKVVKGIDIMRTLRNEVRSAFASVDAAAKITD